jgi:hypothetical protein
MPYDAMEQERTLFLYALYIQSAGDARQGVPYEALIDALGFGEALTKRLQRELQQEGLVELTAVPPMTRVGRTVMDSAHRRSPRQNIGMPPHGVQLIEDVLAKL